MGSGLAPLTLVPIEALDERRGQALVGDLADKFIMFVVFRRSERQDAVEAVCAVLAVLLREAVLDAIRLGGTVHLPLDIRIPGIE